MNRVLLTTRGLITLLTVVGICLFIVEVRYARRWVKGFA